MRHTIPDDLIRTQQEWIRTYQLLADQPGRTALRRRLIRLSATLNSHPRLRSPAARMELHRLARTEMRAS
ncbi:hypothetical protein DMA15_03440 [Streptomyces sp. WAC 01529]|uniref:hypothetical protein n=1 Tax=Streptomyces sp. WAC 01529 TaxID=2203205 RepID=UPI000F6B782B|nr:hypothetical protein [Streptomyces sp. WAC 01529]AZM51747.1 hypothetical protein DMA15_03440 [Streptomyces sp. WAC 01529]